MRARFSNNETLKMLVSDREEMSIDELALNICKLEYPCWCHHPFSQPISPYRFYLHAYRSGTKEYSPQNPDDDLKKAIGQWVNWHLFQNYQSQLPVFYINNEPCNICSHRRENLKQVIIDELIAFQENKQVKYLSAYSRLPEELVKNNNFQPSYKHILITKENLIEFCKLKNIEVTYNASYSRKFHPFDPFSNKKVTTPIKLLIDEFKKQIFELNPNKDLRNIDKEKLKQHFENARYYKNSKFTIKAAIYLYEANGEWPSPRAVYNLMLDIVNTYKTNHENSQSLYLDFADEVDKINLDDFHGESIPVELKKSMRDVPYTIRGCTECLAKFEKEILPKILIT